MPPVTLYRARQGGPLRPRAGEIEGHGCVGDQMLPGRPTNLPRGLRLNDKTRGWRIAVVEQVIHLRLVTLDDVRLLFPSQVPRSGPTRP